MEVASLKEGEWLCYRGSQFNGERIIMLADVASLMERACSCYIEAVSLMEGAWTTVLMEVGMDGGQFNGERMVGGGQFNGRRMVMLRRWPVLMEREWSCLQRWSV